MKIGFFITARLKSSRLKQKILLDLNGRPVIERVIERCKNTIGIDGVVLCTSTNPQDSVLYNYALKHSIQFYAGSENDVLKRLLEAARYYYYDAFISITADNPLFSIYTAQILVDRFKSQPFDFGFIEGLPIGMATSLLETKSLDIAVHMKNNAETEIWGPFVNRPDYFSIYKLVVQNIDINKNSRVTLDYMEDYDLFQRIFKLYEKDEMIHDYSLFKVLRDNSHLLNINDKKDQITLKNNDVDIIHKVFNENITEGKEYAKRISKNIIPGYREEILSY